jgi:hypothetical protein
MTVGGKIEKNWKVYVPYALMLAGISVLILITVQPYKYFGVNLSSLLKIITGVFACVFIMAGIFFKSQPGEKIIGVISGLEGNELSRIQSRADYRFLETLSLLMGFLLAFCLFQDEKSAVSNLDIAREYNDTISYVYTSSVPLSNIQFWAGERPFTVPLFYKMVGYQLSNFGDQDTMTRVAYYQSLFSILAWTLFAASFSFATRNKLVKVIGFAVILLFGASLDVAQWDKAMLTESLSTSLLVIFLATILLAGVLWDRKRAVSTWKQFLVVISIILTGILYSFARDTNSYFVLFIGGAMTAGIILRAIRNHPMFPAYLAVLVSIIAIFGAQSISASRGKRFEFPLIHIVYERIMPSKGYLNFFIQHGMPFNDMLASMNLKDFRSAKLHNYMEPRPSDPSVSAFVDWIDSHGKTVMMEFYLSHPVYFFTAPLGDFWHFANSENSEYRASIGIPGPRISILTDFFYPRNQWWPILSGVLFIIALWVILKRMDTSAAWFVTLMLFLSIYPLALLVWHSDTYEIERHAFQVAFELRLASWIVIVFLMEWGLDYLKRRKII